MIIKICGVEYKLIKEKVTDYASAANGACCDYEKKIIWIDLNYYDCLGVLIHELSHAYDFETGRGNSSLTMGDEQRAEYIRSFIKNLINLNGLDILERLDRFLQSDWK